MFNTTPATVLRGFLLVALLALAPDVLGQPADTIHVLPGIVVTATRDAINYERAPAHVQALEHADLATANSLADLLRRRAHAYVRSYGTGLASLSLRGGTASQTLVLLDGLPVTDPQLGQVDLSLLPLFFVDRVEVLHGAGSTLYGSDAISGAIHVQTTGTTEPFAVSVDAGMGAFGDRRVGGGITHRDGPWRLRAAGMWRTEEGDFPFFNSSLFPPRDTPRMGADRTQASFFASAARTGGSAQTSLSILASDTDRGLPGPATTTPVGERQGDHQLRLWGAHEAGRWRLRAAIQHAALRYRNPRLQLDDTGRTWTYTLQLETRGIAGPLGWSAGANGGFGQADHPNLPPDARQIEGALFTSGVLEAGALHVYPSLRLDLVEDGEATLANLAPGIGFNLRLPAGLAFKARFARGFRTPTLNDRFWQPGGNPELKPERSSSIDAGLLWAYSNAAMEVTMFEQRVRDQIIWQPAGGVIWSPANVARVRSRGFEASARGQVRWGGLRLRGDLRYTLTESIDRSDRATATYGRQVRYVPRHQGGMFGEAAWRIADWHVVLDASGQRVGRRFVTADESQSLPPYSLAEAGMSLSRKVGIVRLTASLRCENLFDNAVEGIRGYPDPPRHLYGSVRLDFLR